MGIVKAYQHAMEEGLSYEEFRAKEFGVMNDDPPADMPFSFQPDDSISSQKNGVPPTNMSRPFLPWDCTETLKVIQKTLQVLQRDQAAYRTNLLDNYDYVSATLSESTCLLVACVHFVVHLRTGVSL